MKHKAAGKEWVCESCGNMRDDGRCAVGDEPRLLRSPYNLFHKRLKKYECKSWKPYSGPAFQILFGEDGRVCGMRPVTIIERGE